jgi:hypothetical protein
LSREVGATGATLKNLNARLAQMIIRLISISHLYDDPRKLEVLEFVAGFKKVLQ